MSRENVEIVRRIYEASACRDRATVLSLYAVVRVEWFGSVEEARQAAGLPERA